MARDTGHSISAILDKLSTRRATDVLLWALTHPRWEVGWKMTSAAYLNLIEPWWKILRSLALKGRRFATWEELCAAIAAATTCWNAHRHLFVWGRSTRGRRARPPGISCLPRPA
jgi:hypothetical protein